jgi:hypothetical protein
MPCRRAEGGLDSDGVGLPHLAGSRWHAISCVPRDSARKILTKSYGRPAREAADPQREVAEVTLATRARDGLEHPIQTLERRTDRRSEPPVVIRRSAFSRITANHPLVLPGVAGRASPQVPCRACQTLAAVTGICSANASRARPARSSASATALTTAGVAPMVPNSPTPLTPSGFVRQGTD